MNFKEASEAHRNWKVKLRVFINGGEEKLEEAAVRRDDGCALGQWLHGLPANQRTAEVKEMEALHARFHQSAADVVATAKRGQKEQAIKMLDAGTPYADTSFKLIGLLSKIDAA